MPYRINAITGELDLVDTTTVPPEVPTSFVTDAGTAVPVANSINFFGNATQGISSTGVGDTVTYTIADATTAQKGVSRLATNAESIAGSLTTNVVINPGSLGAKLGTQTAKAIPYGAGISSAFSWTAALTDGQLVIGSTAGNPAAGAITSTGGTITVSLGSNTINMETAPSVPTSFATDSGTAVPALGVLTIAGGTGLSTTGAGSTVTVNLDTPVAVTNGGTGLSSFNQGDIIYASAANTLSALAKDTNATRYLSNTGGYNNPAWAQIDLTNGVTGVLPIANGGTNASSFATTDGTVYFDGTRLVTTATGSSGQVLTSNGPGVAPTYQTNAGGDVVGPGSATDNAVALFDGTTGKLIKNSSALTNGQLYIGSTGVAPVAASLTQPAAGITITGGAGSITFALANDLAAVEGLSGTGLATRTAADTWTTRQITSTDSSISITNPAGVAGDINISGRVIQQVRVTKSGNQFIGTTLPYDNTTPQNTEGDQVVTVSITPTNSSNILMIEAVVFGEANVATACMAIFQDTTANALFATAQACNSVPGCMTIRGYMTAGTTSSTTFKMRCGPGTAGTYTVNGVAAGTGIFGGSTVPNTTLVVTEIRA